MTPEEKRMRTVGFARSAFAELKAWLPNMRWHRDLPVSTMFATAASVFGEHLDDPRTVRTMENLAVLCHCHAVTWDEIEAAS